MQRRIREKCGLRGVVPLVRHSKRLKHVLDRAVALGALPWVVPPFLGIALAIKLEDLVTGEDPLCSVFYREERYSQGAPFQLVKFRVLKHSVLQERFRQGYTSIKGLEHDPDAVTCVGRLLVKYYLDELPQWFHVLAGRMSLVGPRPVWPSDTQRREYFARFRIKAGLAGTFQLAKGEGDIFDLDKVYLERYAEETPLGLLRYDLEVLWKTLRKMRQGEGL